MACWTTIPVIQESIASHLTRRDLYWSCLVCWDWNEAFSPFLWRSLAFGKVVPEEGARLARLIDRYGWSIRSLNMYYTTTIASVLFTKSGSSPTQVAVQDNDLLEQTTGRVVTREHGYRCRVSRLQRLLLRNPLSEGAPLRPLILANQKTLTSLRLNMDSSNIMQILRILELAPQLQRLEMTCFGEPLVTHLIKVLETCPRLLHLLWKGARFGDEFLTAAYIAPEHGEDEEEYGAGGGGGGGDMRLLPCFALESLHLPLIGPRRPNPKVVLQGLLQYRFPHLANLQLPEVCDDALPLVRRFLRRDCLPSLTGLDLSSPGYYDRFVLQMIKRLPDHQLKRLKLCGTSDERAMRVKLLDHVIKCQSESLEVLELVNFHESGPVYPSSQWIHKLMCTCAQLEVLRLETFGTGGPFLDDRDMVKGDWVCEKLRRLQVQLCCTQAYQPYLLEQESELSCDLGDGPSWQAAMTGGWSPLGHRDDRWNRSSNFKEMAGKDEQCHLQDRLRLHRVYAQLARLKRLEILDVAVRVPGALSEAASGHRTWFPWTLAIPEARLSSTVVHPSSLSPHSSCLISEAANMSKSLHGSSSTVTQVTMTTTTTTAKGSDGRLPLLEALSVFKNLQEIDFSGTHQTLRVVELCWMKEHWPQLERLVGLPPDPPSSGMGGKEVLSPRRWLQIYWPILSLESSAHLRTASWS
ncbi:hypothetical protein DFQ27_001304 [Actinomortierella ambigua]|uniref:F-box domain-containing protein n=1 Tax=Actinomortierella ambigua TaxID=1343610 RepID=A0A9P6QE71_9FUNG|nr:hypothetical protein DFQ27_001304 [Actinomortierella ambigua]